MKKDILINFELKYLKILEREKKGNRVLLNLKASSIVKEIGNYFYKTNSKDAEKVFRTLFPYFNFRAKTTGEIKSDNELENKIMELMNEI